VLGAPAIILSFTPTNLLRTEGFATAAMTGSILGSVINIILDPIFIQVLDMGAGGAAIATVIGNICADIYYVWFLLNRSKRLSVDFKLVKASIKEVKDILIIGIPASITNLMQSLGIALTNNFLLAYGNDKVAAMGIVMKINMIAVLILVGFAFGVQPLIGYNYGAKNFKRLKEALRFSSVFQCSLAVILTLILSILAPSLISFFMDDKEIVKIGAHMLRMQLISMIFVSIVLIATCTFQSTGKAFGAFLLSISRQGITFAVIIFIASKLLGYEGVVISQAIADFITAILAGSLFFTGLYKEIK